MTPKLTRVLIIIGAVLVIGAVNASIYGKEQVIRHGRTIYLELAPVDPRSLMQGDYMALRFALADNIRKQRSQDQRLAPLAIDARGIATLDATPTSATPRIRYQIRQGDIWLGTNAYFFEEGTADRYVDAKFGEFKLDLDSGEAILVGLRDAELRAL